MSKELSLTAPPPSWMTALSPAAATGSPSSATSSGGAVPTVGASVVLNAGAAAAGMAVLALL